MPLRALSLGHSTLSKSPVSKMNSRLRKFDYAETYIIISSLPFQPLFLYPLSPSVSLFISFFSFVSFSLSTSFIVYLSVSFYCLYIFFLSLVSFSLHILFFSIMPLHKLSFQASFFLDARLQYNQCLRIFLLGPSWSSNLSINQKTQFLK